MPKSIISRKYTENEKISKKIKSLYTFYHYFLVISGLIPFIIKKQIRTIEINVAQKYKKIEEIKH
jgi:hypothetical protein